MPFQVVAGNPDEAVAESKRLPWLELHVLPRPPDFELNASVLAPIF
jgi:hypothetical protein